MKLFTMYGVRKYSWAWLSHWLLSSQLSSISSLGAKTARVTFPEHTALWENSGRGSLGLKTNTETEKGKQNAVNQINEWVRLVILTKTNRVMFLDSPPHHNNPKYVARI